MGDPLPESLRGAAFFAKKAAGKKAQRERVSTLSPSGLPLSTTKGGDLRAPSLWKPPQAVLLRVIDLRGLLRNAPRFGRPRRPRHRAEHPRRFSVSGTLCLFPHRQRQRGGESYSNIPYKPETTPAEAFLGGPGGLFFHEKWPPGRKKIYPTHFAKRR